MGEWRGIGKQATNDTRPCPRRWRNPGCGANAPARDIPVWADSARRNLSSGKRSRDLMARPVGYIRAKKRSRGSSARPRCAVTARSVCPEPSRHRSPEVPVTAMPAVVINRHAVIRRPTWLGTATGLQALITDVFSRTVAAFGFLFRGRHQTHTRKNTCETLNS